ncbi:methyltransferase domain-containing protein [Piscinibacter sakaiensis]|uniref:methyltransferase domain-containing protein n=1 Tax=Piscinibacter sakaiensis TaxID=1547922 RepID=UPI003AAB8863
MSWNPDQYLKFAAPRLRPAIDLLAAVPLEHARVIVDLGCGAGNVTRLLAERWPQAQLSGVDNSAEMLAKAAGEVPGVRWLECNLADWRAERPADLIYSNAALHWLPAHRELFPRLLAQLEPGGVLAVQMPRNFAAPSHTAIADTVAAGPWRARLEHLLEPAPVAPPDFYFDLLAPIAERVDIWETEYLQVLDGPDPVKEWTKGTWLKQFLDALDDPAERAAFERDYAERVAAAYPMRPDGRTLFPFRRLFIVATAV